MTFRNTNIFFAIILAVALAFDWQNHVSAIVYWILFVTYSLIIFWGAVTLSAQFFTSAKWKGDQASPSVALTFDDGPEPQATNQILEILRNNDVKATFFCIGKNVKDNPELVRQMNQEGHLIGNHSFYHGPLFDLQPRRRMLNEINNTNAVITEVTGQRPRFFRPPYGVINPILASAIKKSRMVNVGWSVRSFDTVARDKNKLMERVTRNLKGGDVILFHDRCKLTIEILPEVLSFITRAGLKVEPLDKVLKERAYA